MVKLRYHWGEQPERRPEALLPDTRNWFCCLPFGLCVEARCQSLPTAYGSPISPGHFPRAARGAQPKSWHSNPPELLEKIHRNVVSKQVAGSRLAGSWSVSSPWLTSPVTVGAFPTTPDLTLGHVDFQRSLLVSRAWQLNYDAARPLRSQLAPGSPNCSPSLGSSLEQESSKLWLTC